jgi:hypothetical protein
MEGKRKNKDPWSIAKTASIIVTFAVALTFTHASALKALNCPAPWQPGCTVEIDKKCGNAGCATYIGPECAHTASGDK